MTDAPEITPETWLAGTPYLVAEDEAGTTRFWNAQRRSVATRVLALEAAAQLRSEAEAILEPFARALRSDLVAESNRLEGYEWTRPAVREVVEVHRELIALPRHGFVEAMRQDAHLVEALGLYRAYAVADEWITADTRPREYEIRGLHAEILAGSSEAGRYKTRLNEIEGSDHTPLDPFEVARVMAELTAWWMVGTPDPVLDATVVHAWLTHVHPFADGNGRLARLLANVALTRSNYPPLVLSSQSDRGQYLEALEWSDEGDILPLYDLFATVVKRSAKTMGEPGYAKELVEDRLLRTERQRYDAWYRSAANFTDALRSAIRQRGWDALFQGNPDITSYTLLLRGSSAGNGWYLKVFDRDRAVRNLLFWGYQSDESQGGDAQRRQGPSIFFSIPHDDPRAIHKYRPIWDGREYGLPDEITLLMPTEPRPVLIRRGLRVRELTVEVAAQEIASAITAI